MSTTTSKKVSVNVTTKTIANAERIRQLADRVDAITQVRRRNDRRTRRWKDITGLVRQTSSEPALQQPDVADYSDAEWRVARRLARFILAVCRWRPPADCADMLDVRHPAVIVDGILWVVHIEPKCGNDDKMAWSLMRINMGDVPQVGDIGIAWSINSCPDE